MFALRRALLDDPRLQVARVTEESAKRTELIKAQLDRQRLQADSVDEKTYLASLQIKSPRRSPGLAKTPSLDGVRVKP